MLSLSPEDASILAMIAQYGDLLDDDQKRAELTDQLSDGGKKVAELLRDSVKLNSDIVVNTDEDLEALEQARSIHEWVELNRRTA